MHTEPTDCLTTFNLLRTLPHTAERYIEELELVRREAMNSDPAGTNSECQKILRNVDEMLRKLRLGQQSQ